MRQSDQHEIREIPKFEMSAMTGGDNWLDALAAARDAGDPCVLVTVAEAQGSTPRASGTKMVVFADRFVGTIGGGNLEFKTLEIARRMLSEGRTVSELREFPLGPAIGQCCGGHASLLFEPILPDADTVLLFGAGHVGKALVSVLADLPFRVRWIDEREGEFPADLPANVRVEINALPVEAVATAPQGAFFLVTTHSHALDFRVTEAVLRRGDFAYAGLIGSKTKRARFEKGFRKMDVDSSRLVCPMGIEGIAGKHPKTIAVAVAAQLLQIAETRVGAQVDPPMQKAPPAPT